MAWAELILTWQQVIFTNSANNFLAFANYQIYNNTLWLSGENAIYNRAARSGRQGCKMGDNLSEMSLEELWRLFPVFLAKYQTSWKDWYAEEETLLEKAFPKGARVHHIGSTAIGSIWAKPIIDILVEVPKGAGLTEYKELVNNCGYICMAQNENRISFNKGYTKKGFAEKVFHLHLRYIGDNDELYFRDYLMEHTDAAKEYEEMKLKLWKEYEHDRDGYTDAKTGFVQAYTEQARLLYKDRYGKF